MKTTAILTTFCLLAPCTAMAQDEAPAPAAAETAATTAYDALSAEEKAVVDTIVDQCAKTTETVKTILSGITDRASADAAAPQLQAAFDALDTAWEAATEDMLPAIGERVSSQKAAAKEVDALIKGLMQKETPFYSSIALASVLGVVEIQNVNIDAPGQAPEGSDGTPAESPAPQDNTIIRK